MSQPPLTISRLLQKISKLELELSEVKKENHNLKKTVITLVENVQKQRRLLAVADKISIDPVVHFQSPTRLISTSRNEDEHIRGEADAYGVSGNDHNYTLPVDNQADSSNPPNPSSPATLSGPEADNDKNEKGTSVNMSTSQINEVADKRVKNGDFNQRNNKNELWKSGDGRGRENEGLEEKINLPFTQIEDFNAKTLDKVTKPSFLIPRRTIKRQQQAMILPSDLGPCGQGILKWITSLVEEVIQENPDLAYKKKISEPAIVPIVSQDIQPEVSEPTISNEVIISTNEVSDSENRFAKPELECSVCSKKLKSGTAWRTHMLHHEGVKPFVCCTCGTSFALKATLVRHQLIHQEKKEKCTKCEKTFTTKEDLNKHNRFIHDKEYRYKCSKCPKQFVDSSGFRRHERSHLGIKSHLCSECGRSFAERQNLRVHMKRSHRSETNLLR